MAVYIRHVMKAITAGVVLFLAVPPDAIAGPQGSPVAAPPPPPPAPPPRVVIDNHASNSHTVIEVNGRDRPGLLHDVTAAISDQGLQIASAHITTYGVRAVDVFYVKDVFGLKVENERKLASLREALVKALATAEQPEQADFRVV